MALYELDNIAEKILFEQAESGCPNFSTTSPLSEVDSKAKVMENCRYTMQPIGNDFNYFSYNLFCKPCQSLRSNRKKCAKSTKLFATKRDNPLSERRIKYLTRVERVREVIKFRMSSLFSAAEQRRFVMTIV